MKRCLLCGKKVGTDSELRDHYLNFHKVDPSNACFKKLSNECANRVLNKNCALCGDFLTTLNYKKHTILLSITRKEKRPWLKINH